MRSRFESGQWLIAIVCLVLTVNARLIAATSQPVQVQMQNVALHVDERTILDVRRLRGELISLKPGQPPVFDDKASFSVRIDSAEISIAVDSLSRLMNDHVLKDEGAPLKSLVITTEGNSLKIKGTLKKGINVPFTIMADARVDADGGLRLHPTSIKALGILSKGFLDFVGLKLNKLIKIKNDQGMRIDGDDFVLKPSGLLPPPRIEGRLQAIRIEQGAVVQVFGPGHAAPLRPPVPDGNYMYYRGGTLRFGKLTMVDADMQLIDQDARDAFDFYQEKYVEQLVAGYSKNTRERGLKVYMPDYQSLARH